MLVKSTRCYGTKIIESLRYDGTVIGLTVRNLDKSIHEMKQQEIQMLKQTLILKNGRYH